MSGNQISIEEYRKGSLILIRLIQIALSLEQKQFVIDENEYLWDIVYYLSQYNNVEGITYLGAKNVKNIPQRIIDKWKKKYDTTVYHQFLFEIESQAIFQKMEEMKIAYWPIKGARIARYYPLPGMRFMADNDILYGFVEINNGRYCQLGQDEKEKKEYMKSAQKILVDIMADRGYDYQLNHGNSDVFKKPPIFNFEMHYQIFISGQKNYNYYKDPWLKAKRCFDDKNEYCFIDEDEYIYMIAHTFKHFNSSGCGIRCIIDLFVFLKNKEKCMDWNYINHELQMMDLDEFHRQLKKLSLSCFLFKNLDLDDENLLLYLMKSGTFGNIIYYFERKYYQQNSSYNFIKKINYLKKRLFLSKEQCRDVFPFIYKHMYLMPFLALYRIVNSIILRPKRFFSEFRFLIKKNEKK